MQKIYEVLKSLKSEYGDDLSWLITYPGDWHLLFNYQYPFNFSSGSLNNDDIYSTPFLTSVKLSSESSSI